MYGTFISRPSASVMAANAAAGAARESRHRPASMSFMFCFYQPYRLNTNAFRNAKFNNADATTFVSIAVAVEMPNCCTRNGPAS